MSRRFVSLVLVLLALACVHLGCGDDTCHSNADCSASSDNQLNACFVAGLTMCPALRAPSCSDDAQCTGGQLCNTDADGSGYVSSTCTAPCSGDGSCGPTFTCASDGHCQPRTCAECPSYYSCSDGTCRIPPCSHDADCAGGFCVNGICGPSVGTCQAACGSI